MSTPNKGYTLPTVGGDNNVWGTELNADFTLIDKNLGGVTSVNCAGSADITVSASAAQNMMLMLTGVLTGNIALLLPAVGSFYVIQNNTTGSFTVTVKTVSVSSTGDVLTQGATGLIETDGTNSKWVQAPSGSITVGGDLSGTAASAQVIATHLSSPLPILQGGTGATTFAGAAIVTGPASATANDVPKFSGTSGKIIADGFTVGTSASNLVQLDGSGALPAVSGANLTNLPSGDSVPTACVFPYAGTSAPSGYLLCDGSAISRTTYSTLFGIVGTTYGGGNGSTTFNIPDLRGRAAVGKDDMGGSAASRVTNAGSGVTGTTLGASGGDQLLSAHSHAAGSLGADSGGAHTHGPGSGNYFVNASTLGTPLGLANNEVGPFTDVGSGSTVTASGGTHTHTVSGTSGTTGAGGSANLQPTIILNYIIKT